MRKYLQHIYAIAIMKPIIVYNECMQTIIFPLNHNIACCLDICYDETILSNLHYSLVCVFIGR